MYLVCRCHSETCNVHVTSPSQCEYLFSSFGSFTRWSNRAQPYKVEGFHKWVQIRDYTVQILTTHAQCSVYKNIWFVAGLFLPHFVYASKHTLLQHYSFTCRNCRNLTSFKVLPPRRTGCSGSTVSIFVAFLAAKTQLNKFTFRRPKIFFWLRQEP